MVDLHCAFLNTYNLFEVGIGGRRGPRSTTTLARKISNLGETLRNCGINGSPPDIIGLCEVGSQSMMRRLRTEIDPSRYDILWSGLPVGNPSGTYAQTGLAVLYRHGIARPVRQVVGPSATASGRPKWFAALFEIGSVNSGNARPQIWFIVNHWKSSLGVADVIEASRLQAAEQLGNLYVTEKQRLGPALSMLLVGDFNCEPWERPFRGTPHTNSIVAVRERAMVLRGRLRLPYFYNPMWRWLGEPHDFDTTQNAGFKPLRPLGTFCGKKERDLDWKVWDQILVSRGLVTGGLVHFREDTLRAVTPHQSCSDHHAICATLSF